MEQQLITRGICRIYSMIFYAPADDTLEKRPLLIYIHGGGFTSGSRTLPSIKILCRRMARKGYVTTIIDYRLDPNFRIYDSENDRRAMSDAMHDAKQAIRYFKANADLYGIDTTKVFIVGESAGAVTAMMSAFVDKQSEMDAYPMSDPNNPIGSNSNLHVSNKVQGVLCLCGLLLDTTAMEGTSDEPPILWIHSDDDSFVPIALAYNIVLRALHVGIPIRTWIYKGVNQCTWYFKSNDKWKIYLDSTINFITDFLYPKVINTSITLDISTPEITIYPNPAQNSVSLDLNKTYVQIKVSLISITGKSYGAHIFRNTRKTTLNVGKIPDGIYIIKLTLNHGEVYSQKLMIQ